MSNYTEQDRTLALGGLFQAARMARDIARNGICDATAFEASRDSLFAFDAETVADVYGGSEAVAHGLRSLVRQVDGTDKRDLEISRYVVALLHLADRLLKDPKGMQGLHEDLNALLRRSTQFELGQSTVHEQLAEIYQSRISDLGPRIMIRGEPLHLQNPDNAAKIRVALLAGIRSAVLWRQAGGRKWQLMLRRRAIASTARDLVDKNSI